MKIEFLFFLTKFNENIPADFCKPLKMKAGAKVCTFPTVTARHIRIDIQAAKRRP